MYILPTDTVRYYSLVKYYLMVCG
ncbi:hypothetical protein Nmel_005651 [Mimus melanotis]